MVKKFSANVSNWFKKRLGSTASNVKMNGTQSAGTSENVAREDHVHPVDTSRAAASHTHGNITNAGAIGTAANKPVITTTSGKLSAGNFESTATNIKMDGTQSVGSLNTFARGDHVHPTDTSRASTAEVTQSANGLMSKEDKIKLDKSMSISAGNVGGTTSAYTVSLTGVTLTHGTLIALYNAVGANAASATLNVNSLGAKPIYYNASAITAGRYPNKSTCIFMYNTSIVSTGCWQLIYSYDSNTTYTAATLKDATAHSEAINTAANATQTSINSALDSAIKEVDEKCDDIVAGDIDLSSTHSHTKSQITDFPTSMAPSSHAHGNVTNDGKVGTAANKPLITGTNGVVQAGSFGTAANTFCQGNDSRLSNARTPTDNSVTTAKLVDSSVTNAKLADPANNITEYIIGTHGTTATPNWTGTSTKITSLQAGQVIYFKMTSAGTSAGDTLNLTLANGSTTGAKNIYYNATTKLTTHFPVNSILCLVYDGTNWLCTEIQNTNTTYTAASATPLVDGTAAVGTSAKYAREDHVHPTDTSRAAASHSHTKSEITDFPTTMTPASHTHGNVTNDGKVGTAANKPLITGTNGVVQAGSFGTAANTFCQGNDSRLSNARTPKSHTHTKSEISDFPTSMTPTSHTHGNITNAGAIGTAANKPIITTTSGKLTTGIFGKDANTFAEGNHEHAIGVLASGNIDDIIDDNVYGIQKAKINDGSITGTLPPTTKTGGVRSFLLETRKYDNNSSIQFAYTLTTTEDYNRIFYRGRTSGAWDNWREIIDIRTLEDELDNKANVSHTHNSIETQTIPTNADLNSYVDVGIYNNKANSNVKTMTNTPWGDKPTNGQSFVMIVLEHAGVTQILRPYSTSDYDIYIRNKYGTSWGAWKKVYTNGNFGVNDITGTGITGDDIKYGPTSNTSIYEEVSTKADEVHTHSKVDITDFPTSMTPTSHTHGNITNAGAIGTAANKPIITTTSGKLTTGSFGTTANTFCQGNDSRLSDARTPTAHNHTKSEITDLKSIDKSQTLSILNTQDFSGTIKYYEKNGWATVTWENLACTSTQGGYTELAELPSNTVATIYEHVSLNGPPGIFCRVRQGYLEARTYTANVAVYGHITFPIA